MSLPQGDGIKVVVAEYDYDLDRGAVYTAPRFNVPPAMWGRVLHEIKGAAYVMDADLQYLGRVLIIANDDREWRILVLKDSDLIVFTIESSEGMQHVSSTDTEILHVLQQAYERS